MQHLYLLAELPLLKSRFGFAQLNTSVTGLCRRLLQVGQETGHEIQPRIINVFWQCKTLGTIKISEKHCDGGSTLTKGLVGSRHRDT